MRWNGCARLYCTDSQPPFLFLSALVLLQPAWSPPRMLLWGSSQPPSLLCRPRTLAPLSCTPSLPVSGPHITRPPCDPQITFPGRLKPPQSFQRLPPPRPLVLTRSSRLSITLASAEFLAATICLVNLIIAGSIKLSSSPKMIAKDVGLNCQPHPAFPKRPPLPINLFLSSLIKKKKKKRQAVLVTCQTLYLMLEWP